MSIETKSSSNPYGDSPNERELNPSELPTTEEPKTLTDDELRLKMRPDHKPSILEKLDTRGKKFTAALLLGGVVLGGAGYGASKIAETIGDQNEDDKTHASAPITPGPIESPAPQATTQPSVSESPSNITPLETAQPTPSESQSTLEQASSIEIKVGQTPEALAKNLFEGILPKWNMAGTSDEMVEATTKYIVANGDTHLADHFGTIADKNTAEYTKAIFGPTPNERQLEVAEDFEYVNKWALSMYYMTSDDQEPYRTWNTVHTAELSSESGTTRTIFINYTEHDNSRSGLNHADEIIAKGGKGAIDGNEMTAQVTFDSASGAEVITSYTVVPRNK